MTSEPSRKDCWTFACGRNRNIVFGTSQHLASFSTVGVSVFLLSYLLFHSFRNHSRSRSPLPFFLLTSSSESQPWHPHWVAPQHCGCHGLGAVICVPGPNFQLDCGAPWTAGRGTAVLSSDRARVQSKTDSAPALTGLKFTLGGC